VPGYSFKIIRGLISNFHQPQSTLLLLIAALIGDQWKKIYRHALENEYRFLSYGDGCLFLPG
jgi:S-adenosylmethionine:tRNA ribosyltransferase-isomerase